MIFTSILGATCSYYCWLLPEYWEQCSLKSDQRNSVFLLIVLTRNETTSLFSEFTSRAGQVTQNRRRLKEMDKSKTLSQIMKLNAEFKVICVMQILQFLPEKLALLKGVIASSGDYICAITELGDQFFIPLIINIQTNENCISCRSNLFSGLRDKF